MSKRIEDMTDEEFMEHSAQFQNVVHKKKANNKQRSDCGSPFNVNHHQRYWAERAEDKAREAEENKSYYESTGSIQANDGAYDYWEQKKAEKEAKIAKAKAVAQANALWNKNYKEDLERMRMEEDELRILNS